MVANWEFYPRFWKSIRRRFPVFLHPVQTLDERTDDEIIINFIIPKNIIHACRETEKIASKTNWENCFKKHILKFRFVFHIKNKNLLTRTILYLIFTDFIKKKKKDSFHFPTVSRHFIWNQTRIMRKVNEMA